MMEAAGISETVVNFYQTTRRYNPEESHLRTHRRENLKSYTNTYDDCINKNLPRTRRDTSTSLAQ
jgi:hypothetical protein